jgi:prepilin-type N-terminal cleavage/methylation domain-containing protein
MSKRGFTLIEIMVVISIISLLSSVILVTLSSARTKADNASRNSAIVQYRNAFALYASSHNGLFPWPGNGTYCVGNYNNPLFPNNTCGSDNVPCAGSCSTFPGVTGLESYLTPYIKSFPPVGSKPIVAWLDPNNNGAPVHFLGAVYTCSNGSVLGCSNPAVQWMLEGTNQNCGAGEQYGPYGPNYVYAGLATYCVLFLGQ